MPAWIVDGESVVAESFEIREDMLIFFTGSFVTSIRRNWSVLDRNWSAPDVVDDQPEATPRLESSNLDRFRVDMIEPSGKDRWKVFGGRYKKFGLNCYVEIMDQLKGMSGVGDLTVEWVPSFALYAIGSIPEGKNLANKVVGFELG